MNTIGLFFLSGSLIILALMAVRPRLGGRQDMGSMEFSARLDALDARLGRSEEVINALRSGQMIKAIKIYREDTGASLADAKAAVERIEQTLRLGIGLSPFQAAEEEAWRPEDRAPARSEVLDEEIERLLMQGKKIAAIKLYRERTGFGLREAKDAVEALEGSLLLGSPAFAHSKTPVSDTPESALAVPPPDEEVRRLVLAGEKINAIKLYRQQTGLGLREAKAAVDELERSLH